MKKYSPLCRPLVFDLVGLAALFAFIFLSPPLGSDPGIGWHLKTGEWIEQHQSFIYHDPFLWTTEGRNWVSNQWLADLFFWKLFSAGGWDSLAVFCFLLPLATLVFTQGNIFWSIWKSSGSSAGNLFSKSIPIIVFSLCLLVAWIQWITRPVIFSFTLFGLLFYLVWHDQHVRKIKKSSFYTLVFLIFLIWVNLHSAFPLGLFILAAVMAAAVIKKDRDSAKTYLFALFIGLGATLINPYGFNLHRNILELMGSSYFMKLNAEWHSPDFSEMLFLPLLVSIAGLVMLLGRRAAGLPLWVRILLAVFLCLSLKSIRYISFLGVMLPTVFAFLIYQFSDDFKIALSRYRPRLFSLAAFVVLAFSIWSDLPAAEKFSSDLLNNQKLWSDLAPICRESGGRIYSHPNYGGAITFKLYPECRTSLDDRNELNGEQAYREFLNILENSDLDKLEQDSYYLLPCTAKIVNAGEISGNEIRKYGDVCLLMGIKKQAE